MSIRLDCKQLQNSSNCVFPEPPIKSPIDPPESPINPPESPINPPESPITSPIPTPVFIPPIKESSNSCKGVPPVASFTCIGAQWVSNESVEEPNIEITGPTIIQGNLTINNTITFNGLDSSINVNGCITLSGGGVILDLSEEDIKELSKNGDSNRWKQLLQQNSSCSNDLSTTSIQTNTPKSCKRVSASSSDSSTRSSLSVVFKVDSSRCNLWWIILASVLGGVFLIVIILMLLVTFNNTLKAKVRPFWLRSLSGRNGNMTSVRTTL